MNLIEFLLKSNQFDRNSILINFYLIFDNRVMAAALSLTFGRGGALIGNLIFGFLIDLNCVIPIVLFSAMLFSKCYSFRLHRQIDFNNNVYLFLFLIKNFS